MNENNHTLESDEYRTLWSLMKMPCDARCMKNFSKERHFSELDTSQTKYNYVKFMELYSAIIRSAILGKCKCEYIMRWEDAKTTNDIEITKNVIELVLKNIGFKIIDSWYTQNNNVVWNVSWE